MAVLIVNISEGNYAKSDSLELFGGARINYIINEGFIKSINELDPFDMLTDDVKHSFELTRK